VNLISVAAGIFLAIVSNAMWDAMKATLLGVWNNRALVLYKNPDPKSILRIAKPSKFPSVRKKNEEAKPEVLRLKRR